MSRLPLWDLGRDVSVAVGAYIGIARDQFWSWLANDGYSIRLAEAVKRFEAEDRLNEHEAENDGLDGEPDDLWQAEANAQSAVALKVSESLRFGCAVCDHNAGWHRIEVDGDMPCHMPECGCTDYYPVIRHSDLVADSSAAQAAAAEPPPEVEPKSPQAPAPSGGFNTYKCGPIGAAIAPMYQKASAPLSEADVRRIVREEHDSLHAVAREAHTPRRISE